MFSVQRRPPRVCRPSRPLRTHDLKDSHRAGKRHAVTQQLSLNVIPDPGEQVVALHIQLQQSGRHSTRGPTPAAAFANEKLPASCFSVCVGGQYQGCGRSKPNRPGPIRTNASAVNRYIPCNSSRHPPWSVRTSRSPVCTRKTATIMFITIRPAPRRA